MKHCIPLNLVFPNVFSFLSMNRNPSKYFDQGMPSLMNRWRQYMNVWEMVEFLRINLLEIYKLLHKCFVAWGWFRIDIMASKYEERNSKTHADKTIGITMAPLENSSSIGIPKKSYPIKHEPIYCKQGKPQY